MGNTDKTKEELIKEISALRRRVTELRKPEAEHKQAEKRINHLNAVLRAIRNVNQLIAKENDRDRLLQGACNSLIETRGYYNAWIALLDESGKLLTHAEAGLGKDFLPMVKRLESGELTDCGQRALAQSGVVVTKDPFSSCADCPLAAKYHGRGAITVRLEHGGKGYGLLSISIPRAYITDEQEQDLVREVAGDIAFALHSIELEEARKRMEEALRDSEGKFNAMLQSLSDNISMMDKDLNIIWANETAKKLFGNDIIGKKCYEVYRQRKEPCEPYPCLTLKAFQDGKVHKHDTQVVNKDGEIMYFHCAANVALRDKEGNPTAVIEISSDITERKQMEESLRESERKYRELVERSAHGVAVVSGVEVLFVNKKILEMYRYDSEEEIKTHPFTDFLTPEYRLMMRERGFAREGGTEQPNFYEFKALRKDGTTFDAELVVNMIEYQGTMARQATIRDITEYKRAEEALRESEEFSSSLLADAPTPVLVINPDTSIRYVNPALERLTGFPSNELIGAKSPYPWWMEETLGEISKDFKENIYKGMRGVERLFRRKDGGQFWVKVTSTTITHKGEFKYYLSNWVDITERKQAEGEIRILSNAVSGAIDAISIADIKGTITYVNSAMEETYGYKKGELLGKPVTSLNANPEIANEILSAMIKTGSWNGEIESIKKNKETFPALLSLSTVRDEKGNPIAMMGALRDITERKQAEEELRESEEKLRHMFESVSDGLAVTDSEDIIKAVNDSLLEMHGFRSRDEILGKHASELIAPVDRERARLYMQKILEVGNVRSTEFTLLRADGSTFLCELSMSILKDASGNPIGSITTGRDVTERKQAEEKEKELRVLKDVDRLRTELLANVSHELRTPLTSIKGFANTLLQPDVKWSEEEQQNFLQAIDQESDRLAHLVNDLLDMSRLEAGAMKLEKDNCHLSGILDSISDRLASLTEHHQLEVMVSSGLPTVYADETRIGQVLTNLVENAVRYSERGGPIMIAIELSSDQVITSVTDEGEGIPAELLDRVFDRFYQAESIAAGRKSGTGLGLSICRGIVEAHSGKIWVESKSGEGSKFSFSLPVGKGHKGSA